MSHNPASMGERIKTARKAAHMSQTELATLLGKTMRTIQKYESGEIEPSIAIIDHIAEVLNVIPSDLIGYQKQDLRLESIADVISVLDQLNRKVGIRFDIDVQRPPYSDEYQCALRFDGQDCSAEYNSVICRFLERFQDERSKLETYWISQENFDHWIDRELDYYADIRLNDREVEDITDHERIQRRNELDRKNLDEMKKAAETDGSND